MEYTEVRLSKFVYVSWPLSQQWYEMAHHDEKSLDYKREYGEHLCSDYDENLGVYVNSTWYDSFI